MPSFVSQLPDCRVACTFTCLPVCVFTESSRVSQCCQIAGPHICLARAHQCTHLLVSQQVPRATCSPVCACTCLPACAFICRCVHLLVSRHVPSLVSQRCQTAEPHSRHVRISASAVGWRIKVFFVGAQACSLSAHNCSLLARKNVHQRRARVLLVGAACLLLARNSVHCWLISVPTVGAQKCPLSAHKCVHSRRKNVPCWHIIVPSVSAHKRSLLARKRDHCRRTRVSLLAQKRIHCRRMTVFIVSRTSVLTVGAQECSLLACKPCHRKVFTVVGAQKCPLSADKCVHSRRTRVCLVGASSYPVSAHTIVPCWRTSLFTEGALECSLLAQNRVHRRRMKVFTVCRINVFLVGA